MFCASINPSMVCIICKVKVMVFSATYNNIKVISWCTFLLVEETGVSGGNHRVEKFTDRLRSYVNIGIKT